MIQHVLASKPRNVKCQSVQFKAASKQLIHLANSTRQLLLDLRKHIKQDNAVQHKTIVLLPFSVILFNMEQTSKTVIGVLVPLKSVPFHLSSTVKISIAIVKSLYGQHGVVACLQLLMLSAEVDYDLVIDHALVLQMKTLNDSAMMQLNGENYQLLIEHYQ